MSSWTDVLQRRLGVYTLLLYIGDDVQNLSHN